MVYDEGVYRGFCGVTQFEKREKLSRCSYRILGAWTAAPAAPAQGSPLLNHWSPTQCLRDLGPLPWLWDMAAAFLVAGSNGNKAV